MNLFRSEEHITRWLAGRDPGFTTSVTKLSELAHAWWSDRVAPTWQPHSRQQNQALLDQIGLTDTFWQLA
jgi:hypothetical protein